MVLLNCAVIECRVFLLFNSIYINEGRQSNVSFRLKDDLSMSLNLCLLLKWTN